MLCAIENLEAIAEATLRELCASGAELRPTVLAVPDGGFALVFAYGEEARDIRRVLGTSRGPVRRFGSIDTAGFFLRELGFSCFPVDLAAYQPGRVRGPRPDRAEALRKTRTSPKQVELLL